MRLRPETKHTPQVIVSTSSLTPYLYPPNSTQQAPYITFTKPILPSPSLTIPSLLIPLPSLSLLLISPSSSLQPIASPCRATSISQAPPPLSPIPNPSTSLNPLSSPPSCLLALTSSSPPVIRTLHLQRLHRISLSSRLLLLLILN